MFVKILKIHFQFHFVVKNHFQEFLFLKTKNCFQVTRQNRLLIFKKLHWLKILLKSENNHNQKKYDIEFEKREPNTVTAKTDTIKIRFTLSLAVFLIFVSTTYAKNFSKEIRFGHFRN